MRTVPLHGKVAAGRFAWVSERDYDLVIAYRWHVIETRRPGRPRHGPYAVTAVLVDGKRGVSMHSLITGWPHVDHRNGYGLDNTRPNLRPATQGQNNVNRAGWGASGFKGVYLEPGGRWRARIRIDGVRVNLGYHDTPEAAALAYDAAALAAWGEYAHLNFT
jgi:AP2 domain